MVAARVSFLIGASGLALFAFLQGWGGVAGVVAGSVAVFAIFVDFEEL